MTHLLSFGLCLAGFVALAIGASRQQRVLFGGVRTTSFTMLCRFTGAGFLTCAAAILIHVLGWGLGLVMFSGDTSITAGGVYLSILAYSKRQKDVLEFEC